VEESRQENHWSQCSSICEEIIISYQAASFYIKQVLLLHNSKIF
jgi:hypothetical protein